MRKESILLHGGYERVDHVRASAVPIYQTTSYVFRDSDHAASLFAVKDVGYIYTRIGNPTVEILEKRLAMLHKGTASLCLSSGQAAITYTILNLVPPGYNFVSSKFLYGGTYNLFKWTLGKFGIEARFVDSRYPEELASKIDEKTRAVFLETIGNPMNNVDDFQAIADVAHNAGIPLIVDNTVMPYLFNPFDYGADIVVYSTTKFITGNGTSIGGCIVEKGDFNWANGKFPWFVEPDPSYHGLSYWEAFGNHENAVIRGVAFTMKARLQYLRDIGACMSPFNAFLVLLGLETLHLRMPRHCDNALKVAKFLKEHPKVSWVNYPGLGDHPDHVRAKKYFNGYFGAIIGFGIRGGYESAKKFVDSLKMILHLANIGDARSLVIHPASTTHQQLTSEERKEAMISDDFIRLSVGIENVDDIISDLSQALERV